MPDAALLKPLCEDLALALRAAAHHGLSEGVFVLPGTHNKWATVKRGRVAGFRTYMAEWRAAGAAGFGIGSALYKPGKQAAAVRDDAKKFIAAWTGTTLA